jgi:hypothetical protein
MLGVEFYIFSVLKYSSNCSFQVTFKLTSLCPWHDGSMCNMQKYIAKDKRTTKCNKCNPYA